MRKNYKAVTYFIVGSCLLFFTKNVIATTSKVKCDCMNHTITKSKSKKVSKVIKYKRKHLEIKKTICKRGAM